VEACIGADPLLACLPGGSRRPDNFPVRSRVRLERTMRDAQERSSEWSATGVDILAQHSGETCLIQAKIRRFVLHLMCFLSYG
jgi:hypothetical protein